MKRELRLICTLATAGVLAGLCAGIQLTRAEDSPVKSGTALPFNVYDEMDGITLTADWKQYSFNLAGKDLSHIKTGFVWTVEGQGHPVIFYLDDIRFE